MPELIREFTNFTPGELTYHESVEGGELTAQEMINLRIGSHGALRQRHSIRTTLTANDTDITGCAATQTRLYFINADGELFFRNNDRNNQTDTEIQILGRPRIITTMIPAGYIEETKLDGRISLIHEYKDFVILTSEGEDQGYWIDRSDEDDIKAYPLGFNPPTFEVTPTSLNNSNFTGFALTNVFYRFTYVRDTRSPSEVTAGNELPEEPFNTVESNPSDALLVQLTGTRNGVRLTGIKFPNPDGLENGIAVYRSRAVSTSELTRGLVDADDQDLDYKRVGIYPPTPDHPRDPLAQAPAREQNAAFDDFMTNDDRSEQEPLRFDNDRLPNTVKSFTLFNDRVFAPNADELRYSDVRFGNLALYAFPETKSIRRPVDTIFAAAYRDMLLFGGRNGLWRLTGNTEYNHDVDRVSNLGAIDAYAITTTEDVFGYISPAGLHMSDGISTSDISEPIQAHFENQEPIRGNVTFLPNGNTLWSVVYSRLDGSINRQTFMRGRQWQQWANIEIEQSARFEQKKITGDTETIALIVEDTPFIRLIQWDNINAIYDNTDPTEDLIPIAWSWKSQKLDWERDGLAARRKKFTELIIEGKADTEVDDEIQPITLTFTIYDTQNDTITVTAEKTLERPHLYKTRVPIRKIGMAIEFKIAGQGNVDIRSLCLKGNI